MGPRRAVRPEFEAPPRSPSRRSSPERCWPRCRRRRYCQAARLTSSQMEGNESSPTIAIDQHDPNKLAAVWVRERSRSWRRAPRCSWRWRPPTTPGHMDSRQLRSFINLITNPSATSARSTSRRRPTRASPSTATITSTCSPCSIRPTTATAPWCSTRSTSRATLLSRRCSRTIAVYQWVGVDAASSPTMAVDDNVASFSDTNSIGQTVTQTDPTAGNVYVAWTSADTPFTTCRRAHSIANRIRLTASSDGGNNFGGDRGRQQQRQLRSGQADQSVADDQPGACGTACRDPRPDAIRASRRSPAARSSVGYDDFNTGATASPAVRHPEWSIRSRAPWSSRSWATAARSAMRRSSRRGTTVHTPNITDFSGQRQRHRPELSQGQRPRRHRQPDPPDPGRGECGPDPAGREQSAPGRSLQQPDSAGERDDRRSGNHRGQPRNHGQRHARLGTVFDDQATRSITDTIRHSTLYRPLPPRGGQSRARGSTTAYRGATATSGPGGINGVWTLQITDFRNSGTTTPIQNLRTSR